MKNFLFLLILSLLTFEMSAQFRLSSRDTSALDSTSIFAMQDGGSWRQATYNQVRDDIRAFDADPTGSVMAEKFRDNETLWRGSKDYYDDFNYSPINNWVFQNKVYDNYFSKFAHGTKWGLLAHRYSNGQTEISTALGDRAVLLQDFYVVSPREANSTIFNFAKGNGEKGDFNSYLTANSEIYSSIFRGMKTLTTWDELGKISFSTGSQALSSSNWGSVYQIETVLLNTTSKVITFKIQDDGKWYNSTSSDGWTKFESGVLEQKTAVELLQEAAPNLSLYNDNAAASSALGTGKMWRDASGFVRVTY